MFRTLLLLIGLMGVMQAGVLDFWNASQAKEAYTKGDYPKASSLYQSLDQTNDNVAYNLGNAYYKEKAYDKALEAYQHVKEPSFLPQTLHNMGNLYAQLHQNDQAIAAYESALKLKEDEDTRFNLELLKKEQKKQDQKQDNPSDKNQNKDNQQKSSSKENDTNTSNNSSNSEPQQSNKPSQNEPKNAQDTTPSAQQQPTPSKPEEKPSSDKQDAQKEADQKSEQQAQVAQAEDPNAPISNHEERQWDKILNQRGVNTLMLPLSNKGKKDDTSKPW